MNETSGKSQAGQRRTRLLDAALEAFADKGFHGTTTRDIASAAGMSPAAIYVHHKSKEELLYLIALKGNQDALERLHKSLKASEDPIEQLHHILRDFAATCAEHNTITRVITNELAALTPEHRAEIGALRRQIGAKVRELIERGIDTGDVDVPDPEIAATAVMSLGVDVARWYREGGRLSPTEVGDSYGAMALRLLGVDPARVDGSARASLGHGRR